MYYYDNEDFNSNDVYEIAKNTTKEDELFEYADIPDYLKNNFNIRKENKDYKQDEDVENDFDLTL